MKKTLHQTKALLANKHDAYNRKYTIAPIGDCSTDNGTEKVLRQLSEDSDTNELRNIAAMTSTSENNNLAIHSTVKKRILSGQSKDLKQQRNISMKEIAKVESTRNYATSHMALVPYHGQFQTGVLSKYEDYKSLLEIEYDNDIKNDKDRKVKNERVDMRKMLREHDEGTEKLYEMSTRRSKLMQLMIKKDFKSFHTEMRPLLQPQPSQGEKILSLPPSTTQTGKALEAITGDALAPRSILGRS